MEPVDAALLVLRVVVGATMILHGLNHWLGGGRIEGTAGWFESLGLRPGRVQAWASVVTEIGAGAALVLGLFTPLASAVIISVMLVAGITAHKGNGFFVFKDGYEYVLVLGVVAAVLAVTGPGALALDGALWTGVAGWTGGAVAVGLGAAGTALLLAMTWRPSRSD
ncbi:DoxX family protein [Nocardiopsis oceani]